MKLEELGFSDWFEDKLDESMISENKLARVTAASKEKYLIRNEVAEISAEITGKMLFGAESNLDLPAVGDWVYVQYFNQNTFAIINGIMPRRSLLKRKVAGKKFDFQPIASNIDMAFIMQSVEFDFNPRRLERYLTMVNESDIKPFVLLSKIDLISHEELDKKTSEIKSQDPELEIIIFSNKTQQGLNDIQMLLKTGKTYCLLGSSGVGKTTLINRLIGEDRFETDFVRGKDGKGRHVTSRRQMIILEDGGMIVDTPGMRELGNIAVDSGLKETFSDIKILSQDCHFNDCKHVSEPGCAVIKAVKDDELSDERYQNYLKIRKESNFNTMSYLEKRNKDKVFGKFIKTAKKDFRKKH
ncbi:ribosome small subunit-dependent GTPase A [Acidobacteriota bacterium]